MATTTPAAPPNPPADRGSPCGFVARPRTLRERMEYLRLDAERILARPDRYQADEDRWARASLRVDLPRSTRRKRCLPAANGM